MIKINRIHVFGCSFTAGAELIDHIVFSSLGNMDEIDRKKFSAGSKFEAVYKSHISPEWRNESGFIDYKKVSVEQKKFAWPAILERLSGISIINHAIPGTSNDLMFYELDKLFAEGKILPTDLVIIGLTSPNRVSYFNPYNYYKPETYHPLADGQTRFTSKFTQEYNEKIMNKKYMLWKFHEAKLRCKFYNSLIKDRVIFFEAIHKSKHYYQTYCDGAEEQEFLNNLMSFEPLFTNRLHSSFNVHIPDYRGINGEPNYATVHGNFHPKVEVQEKVAHDIYRELQDRYQIGEILC